MAMVRKMTLEELRTAYRLAVERCLVEFFARDAREAEALVDGWWERLSVGRGLQSGLFLHAEAIDTAADLARGDEVPLSEENRARYRGILEEAARRAMRVAGVRDAVAESVLPDGVAAAVEEKALPGSSGGLAVTRA